MSRVGLAGWLAITSLLNSGCALALKTYSDDVTEKLGWHVHEGKNSKGEYSVWFHDGPALLKGYPNPITVIPGPVYIVTIDYKGQKVQIGGGNYRETHKNKDSDGINDPHQMWVIKNESDRIGKRPAFRFTFDACSCYGNYNCSPYNQERIAQATELGFQVPDQKEVAELFDYAERLVKDHYNHHLGNKSFVFQKHTN